MAQDDGVYSYLRAHSGCATVEDIMSGCGIDKRNARLIIERSYRIHYLEGSREVVMVGAPKAKESRADIAILDGVKPPTVKSLLQEYYTSYPEGSVEEGLGLLSDRGLTASRNDVMWHRSRVRGLNKAKGGKV